MVTEDEIKRNAVISFIACILVGGAMIYIGIPPTWTLGIIAIGFFTTLGKLNQQTDADEANKAIRKKMK